MRLRLAMLNQLSAYISDREREGWYYGNQDQFEKRHQKLKAWVAMEIVKATEFRKQNRTMNERAK